jgi:hypothetical protein
VSDISLPGIEYFLLTLAVGALAALALVVSVGLFLWAHYSVRLPLRRKAAVATVLSASVLVGSVGLAIALD